MQPLYPAAMMTSAKTTTKTGKPPRASGIVRA